MTVTATKEDESTRLRRENTERLSKAAEQVELALNRELAKKHGVTSNRVTLVHAVSARLRAMLSQARIGLDDGGGCDKKGKSKKERDPGEAMKRLPNGFINDPPTWLLAHSSEGWTLRGWPATHPSLPTNKAISAWPTATLLSILSMLLNGTILLVLPSPTQPDMETVVRAPKDVEPPIKRSRRSGSVGAGSRAGSVWGSEYGGSDGDPEEMEVLGMLEPTRDDLIANAAPSPSIPASGTNPPDSPRLGDDADADGTTLAPSTSPSSSKVKAHARRKSVGGESVKSRMKAKPKAAAKVPGPRIVLETEDDGEESEAVSSDASSSPSEDEDEDEEEAEETPEPSASPSASVSTSTKKHKRTESSATTSEPPAKKHRRSRSGLDPEERAKLLAEKEAAKAARKAQREADREAKREAKEAERKKRIEARILKEARKEADELARMERERRGVEEVKETKRRMSVAPSEVDAEERDPKRRELK